MKHAGKQAEDIALGNMRALREVVIGHFAQINKKYGAWGNDTLLHIVCREGYLRMVEFIVDPKNVSQFDTTEVIFNSENGKWRTPLHLVFTPPAETYCARKLGVDAETGLPKAKKPEGVTVDSDWIRPGNEATRQRIVELLVARGADINRMDYHEHSPLHMACVWGWVATAALLLENGADPETSNISGQNALMAACEFRHSQVADLLLTETNISLESKNVDGETAMLYASASGSLELVELLCEFGANVNAESYAKDTPLKRACRANNGPVVDTLLTFRATRQTAAFDLLNDDLKAHVLKRLEEESDEKKRQFEANKRAKALAGDGNDTKSAGRNAGENSDVGAWRPYRDKLGRGIFFYNSVSRVSQFATPDDYEKDRSYIMKDATFGMHFYH